MASSHDSGPDTGADAESAEEADAAGTDADRLPQSAFPEEPLVCVREPQTDGSERCLVYPAEAPPERLETQWLAVSEDAVVSPDERR